ncbi:MAG TPA: hypothetical protein VEX18_20955 [Polyangiaceae bacterium]|nr:hypothetical protein [Polyangiaceae bacterium]
MKALRAALLAFSLVAPGSALAQQSAPAAPMPAGHPPVTGGTGAAPAAPEQDAVMPSPEVPPGTILVRLVDHQGNPLKDHELKLRIVFQKISEGEQRKEQAAKTDAQGVARFTGLASSSDFSYRVAARSGPAEYLSDLIQLKPEMGVMSLLHVYPVTRNIEQASIGSRGFIYVETRDDVFQFEVLFRVFNMGGITWVPEVAQMRLPAGFKAFKAGEAMSDVRFEEAPGTGVRLKGTVSPGQHNVSFRFQVPRDEESSASFRFGLLPHVAEIRVIAEAAPSMELDVDGFERPQVDVSNGQRVLVTRHVTKRGEPTLETFEVSLAGIPTPGPGRWIAVLIAAGLAALGFGVLRGFVGKEAQAVLRERDAERARQLLLDELVDLTRARREGRIGDGTFETARATLVAALSRILATHPELGRSAKKAGKKGKPGGGGERIRPSGPASTA